MNEERGTPADLWCIARQPWQLQSCAGSGPAVYQFQSLGVIGELELQCINSNH